MLFSLIILITVILDQLVKILIERTFIPGQSYPLIDEILHLTYVRNSGAAFGLFDNYNEVLILLTILIITGFIYFFNSYIKKNICLQIGFGLIVGGGIGNLIDRIRLGYVVDFLDIRIWPIFNLADIFIVIGTIIFVVYILSNEDFSFRIDN